MTELRSVLMILSMLLLSPLIGIADALSSLAFPILIAWLVLLERVLKREPGLYRFGGDR